MNWCATGYSDVYIGLPLPDVLDKQVLRSRGIRCHIYPALVFSLHVQQEWINEWPLLGGSRLIIKICAHAQQ